ncbi:SAM-dependent methyltransferase [Maritimibacter sp. 55A14]|uniref:SAM-dependent methyltransferase n=1 Tax=Maritimibacter sp. 55A14 TaxID=2174844 RepID=UPI000D608942|nr:cyclopropane-fatty-acyl-phospholipid synthase family protein [Maritimibacter sp. 55A14]PWE33341.1 SAM-dependent methyltransferase [Maritimibacter sp. 55A14]
MWQWLLVKILNSLIRKDALAVRMPDGTLHRFGADGAEPVTIHIHDMDTVRRLVLNPDLAVGEAYMDGRMTIDDDELHRFLRLATRNADASAGSTLRGIMVFMRMLARNFAQYNPMGRARANASHHYDLSGELYDLFLDADKQYSCAYFRSPNNSLEQAQADKKAHIARKLLLEPGQSVLDIGCGWGGMGLTLARDFGARVTGVTLSTEQQAVARRRAKSEGLEDRAEFHLMDYREVTGRFDRIVSVGMFEHVGVPHYREYFRNVRERLAEDGVALIHTIGRSTPPGFTNPWITRYIFPGGYVPAMSEAMEAIQKEGLIVADVEVLRLHYADTLRHWYNRFMANIDRAREIYDDRFCRMWRYYLAASEVGFREGVQVVFQFQLCRKVDAVPLTRDYLYSGPPSARKKPKPARDRQTA